MSHKIKIYIISAGLFLLGAMALTVIGVGSSVSAQNLPCTPNCNIDPTPPPTGNLPCTPNCNIDPTPPPTGANQTQAVDCPSGKATADGSGCQPLGNGCKGITSGTACLATNPIFHYLNIFIDFLSGLVGIVVVGTIIVGGIQYSMAGDNSSAVQEARKRITNGLIALFAFIFLFAFLQWIVPGGLI